MFHRFSKYIEQEKSVHAKEKPWLLKGLQSLNSKYVIIFQSTREKRKQIESKGKTHEIKFQSYGETNTDGYN